jgi:hypothetical protein
MLQQQRQQARPDSGCVAQQVGAHHRA